MLFNLAWFRLVFETGMQVAVPLIVDKQNVIGEKERIGFDPEADRFRCQIDSAEIAIVPKGGMPIKSPKK